MASLASVVIPCFNAEEWIKEAIDSVLNQTYPRIEVIVIDDGSTDRSLNIIKDYGNRVTWRTGPNRGGNHARNQGFSLSQGEYIQYLDADDYLLPTKIESQVSFLETTSADVVYGDWRHQTHFPNGKVVLEDITVSGIQADILESLLGNWWVSPASLLVRRSAIERSGGWDEALKAGQDRDFFLNLVLSGSSTVYQPGCHAIYRRHGKMTVSTSSTKRFIESHISILKKAEAKLIEKQRLTEQYRKAMANSYFSLARNYQEEDYKKYRSTLKNVFRLEPDFRPRRTSVYNFLYRLLGLNLTERLTFEFKKFRRLTSNS